MEVICFAEAEKSSLNRGPKAAIGGVWWGARPPRGAELEMNRIRKDERKCRRESEKTTELEKTSEFVKFEMLTSEGSARKVT